MEASVGRTIFYCLIFFPWTIFSAVLALLISLFSKQAAHTYIRAWGKGCNWAGGLTITVKGVENIPPNTPAIYVSNHQSNFDIPVIYSSLPIQFSWLAKQELFRVPLFGTAMKAVGCIPIDRSNRREMMKSINAASQQIKNGTSVIIFPEGTRSPDGELQEFKKGALLIAAKAKVPVIPIAIHGSYERLPKDQFKVSSGPVSIEFLPPIDTNNGDSTLDELTNNAHKQIAACLQRAVADV